MVFVVFEGVLLGDFDRFSRVFERLRAFFFEFESNMQDLGVLCKSE